MNEKGRGRDGSARAPPAADAEEAEAGGAAPPGSATLKGTGRQARAGPERTAAVAGHGVRLPRRRGVGGRRGRPAVWAGGGAQDQWRQRVWAGGAGGWCGRAQARSCVLSLSVCVCVRPGAGLGWLRGRFAECPRSSTRQTPILFFSVSIPKLRVCGALKDVCQVYQI